MAVDVFARPKKKIFLKLLKLYFAPLMLELVNIYESNLCFAETF